MARDSSHIAEPLTLSHQALFCLQGTHDFDEQATFLNGWNQDYVQLSAGNFRGSMAQIHLPDLSLFWEYTSQSLHQYGHLDADTIAIGIPLSSTGAGMFCGKPCHTNSVHVYSGRNGFEFLSPSDLMIGLIVINRNQLMQLLPANDQYFLNLQCSQARIVEVSYSIYAKLNEFLQSTLKQLKIQPGIANNPHFRDDLTARAVDLVTESLLVGVSEDQEIPLHKSWQVITNTREIVNRRQDNPISVAELCQSLEMSRRSLQYHFEQFLHTSPVAYLRAERLNGVRRMLKAGASVTDAATYWGFWHFGHFSQEYKKMFGELPSVTAKRVQSH